MVCGIGENTALGKQVELKPIHQSSVVFAQLAMEHPHILLLGAWRRYLGRQRMTQIPVV